MTNTQKTLELINTFANGDTVKDYKKKTQSKMDVITLLCRTN
mgnify:CR=1 FL=1